MTIFADGILKDRVAFVTGGGTGITGGVARALAEAGGVKKRAAELLGINYRSFRHRLQKYGLADGSTA